MTARIRGMYAHEYVSGRWCLLLDMVYDFDPMCTVHSMCLLIYTVFGAGGPMSSECGHVVDDVVGCIEIIGLDAQSVQICFLCFNGIVFLFVSHT